MNKKVGIIIASVLLIAVAVSAVLIPLATCKKGGGKQLLSACGYTLSRSRAGDGYAITVEKNGKAYSTGSAAIGVRFDKNDFSAAAPIYAPYTEVSVEGDAAVGRGSISSSYGTVISFSDYYTVHEDGVHVDRSFTVAEAGEDYGFMTELKLQTNEEETILDSEWFIPANYYVNGTHTFLNSAARIAFQGSSIAINAEDVAALMLARYRDGHSFTLTDTTPGYRETTIKEKYSSSTSLYIDAGFNIPGLTISNNENGKMDFSHVYPAYTNNAKDVYTWRMLPVEKGLTRNVSFIITIGEEKCFDEVMKNSWRNAYSMLAYADKRYTAADVYDVLIDRVDGSYSANNAWGKIPMYSSDSDHYIPDSGFLYRNLEFGMLMLSEGRQKGDAQMIENAWKVIKYQLENDKLEYVTAYAPNNSVYKRVMYDGFEGAVNLYIQELEAHEKGLAGCADKELLSWLLNYIVDKAEKFKDDESLMALTFYVPLWRYGERMYVDYKDVALRLLNTAYDSCEDYKGFYGGIENSNNLISVVEDYMIFLRAFVDAYEIDGRQKWLNKAVELANYLETYQMIQPFSLNPNGATGAEGKNLAFLGNERFLAHGYVFNNSVHDVLDGANTSSVIEYYRLYKYTGDEHYLNYAEAKLYNAFIYINMGDKVGHMDDPVQSSGIGFINEFVGNGMGSTTNPDLGMRGAAHDSIIAWNIWQIVLPLKWFKDNCGGVLPTEISAGLTHDLAKTRYASGEGVSPAHGAQKAVDGNPNTSWIPTGEKTAVIDLNEFCTVTEIKALATDGAKGYVSFSKDGNAFSEEKPIAFNGAEGSLAVTDATTVRYVKVRMETDTAVSQIEVMGVPVFYKTLSDGATVLSCSEGSFADCTDASNYRTVWDAGSSEAEAQAVIDLGEVKEIFQTAIKPFAVSKLAYRIEISENGTDWSVYTEEAQTVDKFLFVCTKYARARYVKLTLLGTNAVNYKIADIKIQGA